MRRRGERGRKVAVDGESKAENPKGNHSTRDIVWRVVEVLHHRGKKIKAFLICRWILFWCFASRFQRREIERERLEIVSLGFGFLARVERGMFFLGNLGGRV